jgi:hypothetical protein
VYRCSFVSSTAFAIYKCRRRPCGIRRSFHIVLLWISIFLGSGGSSYTAGTVPCSVTYGNTGVAVNYIFINICKLRSFNHSCACLGCFRLQSALTVKVQDRAGTPSPSSFQVNMIINPPYMFNRHVRPLHSIYENSVVLHPYLHAVLLKLYFIPQHYRSYPI